MVVKPITWEEELINPSWLTNISSGDSPVFENESGQKTTWLTNLNTNNQSPKLDEGQEKLLETLNNFNLPEDEEKPTKPTIDNAVIDGSETTGWNKQTGGILDWLTKEDILNMESWENKTKILNAIKERRDFEGITWEKDSVLWELGFSTIKEDKITTSTVSQEVALDIADQIINREWDFKDVRGSDDQIRSALSERWLNENEISAVINARDARMKEKRIAKDRATMIEEKEQEIRDRIKRESAQIIENVKRSQNTLQRQRSLRGVGRSSLTEQDMLDLEKKWDALIAAATSKANTELALFKAQAEWAEADAIKSIREKLSEQTASLNEQILSQNELENQMVAAGEMENQQAFESLMENLNTAWVDTNGIDKNASELMWFVSDKFGNAIKVNGKTVPVWGITSNQAETINNFADSILRWESTLTTVPSELRGKVINSLATKRDSKWILSATQIATAQSLSQKLFGNTKEAWVKAIEWLMMEWLTAQEITEQLNNAWFSEDYQGAMRKAIENATIGLTKEWKEDVRSNYNRLLEEWDEQGAKELLLLAALEGSWADVQKSVNGRRRLVWALSDIREELANYVEAGWDTSLLIGKIENIQNKIWATKNAELVNIGNKIALAVQDYRQSRSGAAFSESEAKEYANIFPWTDKSIELNAAKINSVLDVFADATEDFYSWKIGVNNYNEIFPNGVMSTLHGNIKVNPSGVSIKLDESETSDLDEIFWSESIGWQEEFTTSSGFKFKLEGLGSPDQTGLSKVQWIWLWTVTQDFWATSPLSIDNVKLADWSIGTPGIDIDWKIWDPIPSPISGTVKKIIKSNNWLGNRVVIVDTQGNEHYFNHLDWFNVEEWKIIKKWQQLGTIGNSWSVIPWPKWDWSHLDYRVKSTSWWIDPKQFLNS